MVNPSLIFRYLEAWCIGVLEKMVMGIKDGVF